MFNFDLSIRYNEVHCHSLNLYPFFSSKIIMVSPNLDYCSRKVTHFLKYPTVTVTVIPSSLKFNFIYICRENKTFNYTNSLSTSIRCQSKSGKQNRLTSSRQTKLFRKVENSPPALTMHPKWPRYTRKTAINCRIKSWEDCIILL